jgi:outer membrane lipoprotein-sorting protein
MKMLRKGLLLTLSIILFGCSKSQYPEKHKPQTPREVLKEVQKHFKSIDKLAVKGEMDMNMSIGINGKWHHRTVPTSIFYAVENPHKFRFEEKNKYLHVMVIANKTTIWKYSAKTNEYTEKPISQLEKKYEHKRRNFKRKVQKKIAFAFNPLADSIKSISTLSRDTLMMPDSTQHITTKLSVDYQFKNQKWQKRAKKNPMVKDIKLSPTTLWIDTKNHHVLKESVQAVPIYKKAFKKKHPISLKIRNTTFFTSYNENPTFADSIFVFQAPPGATKVDTLIIKK